MILMRKETDEEKHSRPFQLLFSDSEFKEFERAAKDSHLSKGAYIRMLLFGKRVN